jgi:hypothetical protein
MNRTRVSLCAALLGVVVLLGSGCAGKPSAPAAAPAQTTQAGTASPGVVPGNQASITVGQFTFRVLRVVGDTSIVGLAPLDMGSDDRILFVEFQLPKTQHEAFAKLSPTLTTDSGSSGPAAWLDSSGIHTLVDAKMTGAASTFAVAKDAIALAYVAPKTSGQLRLDFPSGEKIDLTPLMQ